MGTHGYHAHACMSVGVRVCACASVYAVHDDCAQMTAKLLTCAAQASKAQTYGGELSKDPAAGTHQIITMNTSGRTDTYAHVTSVSTSCYWSRSLGLGGLLLLSPYWYMYYLMLIYAGHKWSIFLTVKITHYPA